MDDALLMRVLDGPAYLDEQVQPLRGRQVVLVTVVRDPHAPDQLHHEVGPAGPGGSGIQHPGDVRMVHQGQRLPLGLEAGHDLLGIHAELDDFECHAPPDGLFLLRHVHDATAAFANLLEELVVADAVAGFLGNRARGRLTPRFFGQKAFRALVRREQSLDLSQQFGVLATGAGQERGPFLRANVECLTKDRLDPLKVCAHRLMVVLSH